MMSTQNVLEVKKSQIKPKPKHPNYAPQAELPLRLQSLILTHDPAKPAYRQALSAFAARIGAQFSDAAVLKQAVTFADFLGGAKGDTNDQFVAQGQKMMHDEVANYAKKRYPNLTEELLEQYIALHTGPDNLADLALQLGVQHVVLCKETQHLEGVEGEIQRENSTGIPAAVLQNAVFSIVGAFHQAQGEAASKNWIAKYILSREVDPQRIISPLHPKTALSKLQRSLNRPVPLCRILTETGRFSNTSMYVVGVFSGNQLLGEGHGRAIKLASNLAARNALISYYLKENPL